MSITKSKALCMPTVIFAGAAVLVWVLSCANIAVAFDFHGESAHGNDSYGVNRSGTECPTGTPCPQGDCTHCHDTFDDAFCGVNDLMLFNKQYFCVQCHQSTADSYQVDMPPQGLYSRKFGGDLSINCPSSVKSAFMFIAQAGNGQPISNCNSNKGSAHYLADIADFLQNKWGFGPTSDIIDPCEGCHNPHRAQRHNYPVGTAGTSPISLPSTHGGDWDVFGAETTQRMDSYASPLTYQAPARGGGGYEPEGNSTDDGSNMPDYVTFCTQCHNSTTTIYSEQLGRDLHQFDWATEKHGLAAASDGSGYTDLRSPYQDTGCGTYVLSCTDCHEPHGSPNPFLTRPAVNTFTPSIPGGRGEWTDLCEACHDYRGHDETGPHWKIVQQGYCTVCHIVPSMVNAPCTNCHYHGGSFETLADTYKTF
jgi:hypothetical protein